MKKTFCFLLFSLFFGVSHAQTPILENFHDKFSPYFFGPNAFPIPDIHDGKVLDEMRVELYHDYFLGKYNDRASVPSIKLVIPLFSDRVNLSSWVGYDIYNLSPEKMDQLGFKDEAPFSGALLGDIYVSTDIQLFRENKTGFKPDVTVRVVLKTASGGHRDMGRYYDSPGYFFDLTLAKSKYFENSFFEELRFILTTGFLCWQVHTGLQNDAVMYGAKTKLRSKFFSTTLEYGGYVGWIGNGDHPQAIKASLTGHIKKFDIFFLYQYGIQDFPYQQFRLGIAYQFPLGKKNKEK